MRLILRVKRVYEEARDEDGLRVLVDRLWPRGLRKDRADVDLWLREAAPSDALRKWYGHDPSRWEEFKRRYFAELEGKGDVVDQIVRRLDEGAVTLLFSTRELEKNNAVALKEYLERRAGGHRKG